MAELALILLGALLVNNFVLAQFLGLCPFIGATGQYDAAAAMGLATTFVLTTSAATSHLVQQRTGAAQILFGELHDGRDHDDKNDDLEIGQIQRH